MKKNDIMLIIIPTFIFVFIWIIFSVYHSFVTSTIPEVITVQISPITPSFDNKTIDLIKTREEITPVYQMTPAAQNNTSSSSAIPVPVISPIPSAINNQQQASAGGNLTQ